MSIRIRRLRLVGTARPYDVDFTEKGSVLPLSVIAGEISTGKTSILEFIDYCLGASRHPRHIEIERRVRASLLEVELGDEKVVIERPVFATQAFANVHRCSLDQLDQPHTIERKTISPPGDPSSLSMLLLSATGLAGIRLKEAPTRDQSGTDPLSFRDLMWLCFLPNQRLDNKQLLHESQHMQALKLRQVIEVVFEIYDDQLAAMGQQLELLQQERRDLTAEITSLETFLRENEVPGRLELEGQATKLEEHLRELTAQLDELSARMQAETAYAKNSRAEYAKLRQLSGERAARLRDRETLLRRLLPLRGQYSEDERKLTFFEEAGRVFDPLRVKVCPACLQELPSEAQVDPGGSCSLCHQQIAVPAEPVDIATEKTAVRARLRAIERYIEEVEAQLAEARSGYEDALASETAAQRRLDDQVANNLSPFVAQRDELVREREAVRGRGEQLKQYVRWHEGLERRHADASRLEARIAELRARIAELQQNRPDREEVTSDLSDRFEALLREFGFPKLDSPEGPYLNDQFVPYVRGNRYSEIGSTGALTLIALAWQLALFERSVEQGKPHPGFLLIDSPQKNLVPEPGGAADEFRDPAIVQRVWDHLAHWTASMGSAAQLIVVDNRPPTSVDTFVVRSYSGDAARPPYGLIEDETG